MGEVNSNALNIKFKTWGVSFMYTAKEDISHIKPKITKIYGDRIIGISSALAGKGPKNIKCTLINIPIFISVLKSWLHKDIGPRTSSGKTIFFTYAGCLEIMAVAADRD